ncbi:ABC transporter substrate-binding protein [Caballeronia sp. DA-9]|uniref:ABC transporter substrate-binding protein n=1 Tax=Caballeronia sp. DA-9 TaxID=3436237 RepID=UPI003F66906D
MSEVVERHPDSPDATGEKTSPIALWYTRCGVPTSFGIAVQRGLFDEEFADGAATLTALQDSSDPVVLQSHFTHAHENLFRHGSNYPAIWAQANGANTRVLGLSFLRGAQTLLALPGSGIIGPADLKGKRLLVPRRSHEQLDHTWANTLRFYDVALRSAGLTLGDVQLVEREVNRPFFVDRRTPDVKGSAASGPAAFRAKRKAGQWSESVLPLIGGEVDVITSGGGIGASSLQYEYLLGLDVVFDLDWVDDDAERANLSTPLVFAVKADLLDAHPELVSRVLYRTLDVEDEARRNPAALVRHIANEQFVPEYLVHQAYGDQVGRNFELDFAPAKIAALRSQVAFLRRIGVIEREIDVDAWLAPAPLEVARRQWAADRGIAAAAA